MKIEKIITLANNKVRLRFLAMERSLRATGCQLPLLVIPYDDKLFDLPNGSTWWEVPEITSWLKSEKSHSVMRKYQCLTVANYQFVDADVCFLKNPEEILKPYSGFITSCGHWHNPEQTITQESREIITKKSTIWQKNVFNTGQFACDRTIFEIEQLKYTAMRPDFVNTCIRDRFHEQPGLNLLVFASGVKVTNLTLPPLSMESTWAGDYPDEFEHYWSETSRQPYLIHWAGIRMDVPRPIHQIFYNFLTHVEKAEWDEQVRQWSLSYQRNNRSVRGIARRFKRAFQTVVQQ
ncbi:hypothetical protein FNW02_19370 [Komarekiella sp. 'clone 1']|uniref:Nucleotide-diphospho-sugar transferase domain-containing protein n=1 Tax=Komarekiella delphini-convector SJRDD-AB1 TaxID=2593771 RepID=A0AA40VS81_9NOST|nr:hypothetical protein [Komarekiella delphini-convector]MBD6617924.1 hypothetical protein [Komarekiella delphini-convector SJRDD-AB1]